MADDVTNPARTDLLALQKMLGQLRAGMNSTFVDADKGMQGKKVWSGTAAEKFAADLHGRSARLAVLVTQVEAAVQTKLHSTPAQCTAQQAQQYASRAK